jgi:hypothetical protein
MITTTHYVLGEIAEKMRTVVDEDDLQESYGISAGDAELAVLKLMRMDRMGVEFDDRAFTPAQLEAIAGECDDAAVVQRDIAKELVGNERAAVQRGARDLEAFSVELRALLKK